MPRTTPTTADLMPEVLELLKRENELKKDVISTHMRIWIEKNGFDERDRSIGWALNRLAKEGYVAHPRKGIWQITDKGLACTLTIEEAQRVVSRSIDRERR
jgi:restriction endonuclease Mrr